MNIQLADRSRLLGGVEQLQNDRLMQNIAGYLDLGCQIEPVIEKEKIL